MGERLSTEEVSRRPQAARVTFGKIPGTDQLYAEMFDAASGHSIDQLRTASIVKVDRGVMIKGWEIHGGRAPTRQSWWCLPGPLDDLTIPAVDTEAAVSTSRR